jgi:hypothetical protein
MAQRCGQVGGSFIQAGVMSGQVGGRFNQAGERNECINDERP